MYDYARRIPGGRTHHVLVANGTRTRCGVDVTGSGWARWSAKDNRSVDIRPTCEACRTTPRTCTCGALDFGTCFCRITLAEFLATPAGPLARRV